VVLLRDFTWETTGDSFAMARRLEWDDRKTVGHAPMAVRRGGFLGVPGSVLGGTGRARCRADAVGVDYGALVAVWDVVVELRWLGGNGGDGKG
jgi:hypothetical protein